MTRKNKKKVLSIIFDIIMLVIGITVIIVGFVKIDFNVDRLIGESSDTALEQRTETFSQSSVNNITIDSDFGELVIIGSKETDEIRVTISDNNRMKYSAEVSSGGTLNITSKSKFGGWSFGLLSGGKWWNIFDNGPISLKYKLEITVPESLRINDLDVTLNAGSVNVSNIFAEHIKIDKNAGETKMNNVNGTSLNIEQNAGAAEISNANFQKISLKNNAGKITALNITFEELRFNVNAGAVNIHAIGQKSEYTIDVETNAGTKIPYQEGTTSKFIIGTINAGDVNIDFSA